MHKSGPAGVWRTTSNFFKPRCGCLSSAFKKSEGFGVGTAPASRSRTLLRMSGKTHSCLLSLTTEHQTVCFGDRGCPTPPRQQCNRWANFVVPWPSLPLNAAHQVRRHKSSEPGKEASTSLTVRSAVLMSCQPMRNVARSAVRRDLKA